MRVSWIRSVGMGAALIAIGMSAYVMLYRNSEHELRGAAVRHGYATVEHVVLISKGNRSLGLIRVNANCRRYVPSSLP